MENFSLAQEQPSFKESTGEKFKSLLEKNAAYFDSTLKSTMVLVGGEEFAQKSRDIFILKNTIQELVKQSDFPEKEAQMLKMNLLWIEENDPLLDRMAYHEAENTDTKNSHAAEHNQKFDRFKVAIKDLFETLKGVLPDDMVHELWARNNMFLNLLDWSDNQNH